MDHEDFVLDMFNGPVKKLNVFSATYLVKTPTPTLMGSMNGSTMKSAVKDLISIRLKSLIVFLTVSFVYFVIKENSK